MLSRNEAMGIVERTRKNLVYMREARRAGADVHEVTHLLNSLLGLVVVPWERQKELGANILDVDIETLAGWPRVQELENTYSGGNEVPEISCPSSTQRCCPWQVSV